MTMTRDFLLSIVPAAVPTPSHAGVGAEKSASLRALGSSFPGVLFFGIALALLSPGCASQAPLGEGLSEGGTWQIASDQQQYPVGWADIILTVSRADDEALGESLSLTADISMPSMGHGSSEESTTTPVADVSNQWLLRSFFTMGGPWQIQGTVDTESTSETFAVDVEVAGER